MGYKRILHLCWAGLTLGWIAWCLYWPFYARAQDTRQVIAEADAAYRVCLTQTGSSQPECEEDRSAYRRLNTDLVAPGDENVYQSFAGRRVPNAIRFMLLVCGVPPLIGYALLRVTAGALVYLYCSFR